MTSHYRIQERPLSDGTRIVNKAENTRLDRLVALQFLPVEFSKNKAALERFQCEAHATSALNHTNICTLHDIVEADGRRFLTLECLEGQTLRRRIAEKLLKLDELLDLGIQIANGHDAAPSKGIIYRDVKPANILVSARGQAQIIDFGLTKLGSS